MKNKNSLIGGSNYEPLKQNLSRGFGKQMNADFSDPMDFYPVHPLDLRSSASQP
ncbi:MAG: hypothetical protein HOH62_00800 [Verrucomicrobia bacterium]|jgi:hypothetical protein|nr:hypothetical protein [Verrucomicrobiota bacterium]